MPSPCVERSAGVARATSALGGWRSSKDAEKTRYSGGDGLREVPGLLGLS